MPWLSSYFFGSWKNWPAGASGVLGKRQNEFLTPIWPLSKAAVSKCHAPYKTSPHRPLTLLRFLELPLYLLLQSGGEFESRDHGSGYIKSKCTKLCECPLLDHYLPGRPFYELGQLSGHLRALDHCCHFLCRVSSGWDGSALVFCLLE